jgi:Gram-negative bacterial TonB protein C-terminal
MCRSQIDIRFILRLLAVGGSVYARFRPEPGFGEGTFLNRSATVLHALRAAPLALAVAGAGAAGLGCAGFWEGVREHEHAVSWDRAVDLAASDRCEAALSSIERAQNEKSLTRHFAAESTWLKANCLSALGRREEALAHYRFLRDFLGDSPRVALLPEDVRSEDPTPLDAEERPLPVLDLPTARYSSAARRAGISGIVEVAYELDRDGSAVRIRVTREAHPLLVAWAIEAVAAGRVAPQARPAGASGFAVFHFLSRKTAAEVSAAQRPDAAGSPEADAPS